MPAHVVTLAVILERTRAVLALSAALAVAATPWRRCGRAFGPSLA
ncbi:MAG: hypothetical protein ACYCTF_00370 [Acidiferrobacter sp.]